MNNTQGERGTDEAVLMPAVDVVEDASGISLVADLPGVAKDALRLHVEADQLIIEGVLGLEVPDGLQLTHQEVPTMRYRRVFTLSNELDPERVSAAFEQGVLRLRIPRVQQAQPRRIRIDVG
ncbi:MAG: Hsp20/alpha crystallin family protein [Rhodocyclaceae bacterium]|nr:Hsp20/alpha crystallin family protein [Rhodocyclaceae bacterium]